MSFIFLFEFNNDNTTAEFLAFPPVLSVDDEHRTLSSSLGYSETVHIISSQTNPINNTPVFVASLVSMLDKSFSSKLSSLSYPRMSSVALVEELITIFNADDVNQTKSIETTMMLAERLNINPYAVIHDVNWKEILQSSLDHTNWKFDHNAIKKLRGREAWTIQVLSELECKKLIQLTEKLGYVDVGFDKEYRSNTRVQINDKLLTQMLYDRIKLCCPQTLDLDDQKWKICGLNERFRFCRYCSGQKFETHLDGQYEKNKNERSFYTVNIYLNDGMKDFKGGRTLFHSTSEWFVLKEHDDAIIATPGLALIFNQYPSEIHHSGEKIDDGIKYIMRTDVMYETND